MISKTTRAARWQGYAAAGAGLSASIMGMYCVSLYISYSRASSSTTSPRTQSELTKVYNRTAGDFDAEVGLSEWLMGISSVRQSLAAQCKGHVLEVSAGTARNLGYYRFASDGVHSLTLVDLSREMVEQGKKKWFALTAAGQLLGVKGVPVRFWHGDVTGRMPDPPQRTDLGHVASKKPGYDAIIQTLGLCSTDAPVALLQNLSTHLDDRNPDARIFLLEHGLGHYAFINDILDKFAPAHATHHGCWWNRDIGQIVQQSGLEVVRHKRKNFGTTWIYELKIPAVDSPVAHGSPTHDNQGRMDGIEAWLPRWMYTKVCGPKE